jgi:MFS family permease
MIATVGREHGMGFAMGVLDSAMSLGIISGPLIAGAVLETAGIHWVFHVTGAFGLLAALAFYAMARSDPGRAAAGSSQSPAGGEAAGEGRG